MKTSIGFLLILSILASAVAQEKSDASDSQIGQPDPTVATSNKKNQEQPLDTKLNEQIRRAENYRPSAVSYTHLTLPTNREV